MKARPCCCSYRRRAAARCGTPRKSSHKGPKTLTARKSAMAKLFCVSLLLSILCFALDPAQSQEREKLRVSTLFIGSSLVPLWIAQEQGIFARNGVDVELIW